MNLSSSAAGRRGPLLLLVLFMAGVAQTTLAPRLFFFGGQPDFVFAVVIAAALLAEAGLGALLGLGGGLITAALVGETVGTFLVSRTLAGFAAGAMGGRLFRSNAGVVFLGALLASAVAEGVYVLAAPGPAAVASGGAGLRAILVGTAWNAVLAVPASALLRRMGWGPDTI